MCIVELHADVFVDEILAKKRQKEMKQRGVHMIKRWEMTLLLLIAALMPGLCMTAVSMDRNDMLSGEMTATRTDEIPSKSVAHRFSADLKAAPVDRNHEVRRVPDSRTDLFLECFEDGVPPTGWSAIVNNAFTWESSDFLSYEGVYHATCLYDEYYTGFQDEWLITPVIDLTTGGASWKLDFWWKGSYYWSVSPWNSCDLIVKISTDGGANWDDLWTEHDEGEFTNWEWHNTVIDLSAYLAENNVILAFNYSGYDGAQFSIDAVSINDAAMPTGRCCYGDPEAPSCADVTELDCAALDGDWERYKNCADHPCPIYYPPPPNDDWIDADTITGPFPDTVAGTTLGATVDCPSLFNWNAVWYVFETPYALSDVNIDYCGSVPGLGNIGSILFRDSVICGDFISREGYEWHDCGDGESNPRIWWTSLPGPTTYYLPVYTGNDALQQPFQFTISFSETPPPETGNYCGDPIVLDIGMANLPYTLTDQYTCGRDDWYENTCLDGYDRGEDIVYQLNLHVDIHLSILLDPGETTYTGILIDYTCPADPTTCIAQSVESDAKPHGIINVDLTAGTYYIMVDTWAPPDCIPSFDLTIEEYIVSDGNDCGEPIVVKLPDYLTQGPDNDSYIDEDQTTCGRKDDYDNTCLGNWDREEDIIYRLDVTEEIAIDVFLDPGLTNWTGILIDDNCPPDETDCIQYSTIGIGAHGLYDIALDPGIYYIMVDMNSSVGCIPSFDLTIRPVGSGLVNDEWENCMAIGDAVDLPFSTKQATPDGPGECMTSPNLWYCYTAPCTGTSTISLCESSYDTKLAVYDGVDPNVDPMMGCDDNSCGQQSELDVDVVAGNSYLIEVGGWSNYTGNGILNISCDGPPGNDNCEDVTPVLLTDDVPVTFTGNNTYATHQCDFFDGAHTWHAFTINTTMNVTLDYCSTYPAFDSAWNNLAIGCPCAEISDTGDYDLIDCGDDNITIKWNALEAGTYYYPVMRYSGATGPYILHIVANHVWICGDADGSGAVDIDDVVYLINYIFAGGPAPDPLATGDANCSGDVDIDDVVYLINYIFGGGHEPCDPDGDGVPDC